MGIHLQYKLSLLLTDGYQHRILKAVGIGEISYRDDFIQMRHASKYCFSGFSMKLSICTSFSVV